MKPPLDFDGEGARLRAICGVVRAELGASRGGGNKPRSESRVEALVQLDAARVRRELADGTLHIEGKTVRLGRGATTGQSPDGRPYS